MTRSHATFARGARSGVVAAVVAAGLVLGPMGVALADPSLVPTPTPKPTIAVEGGAAPAQASATAQAAGAAAAPATAATGDVLDQLAQEYAIGSGGGQLSNLLKLSLKLRSMGYKPAKQYLDGLQAAMKYRPNQLPLIAALKDTIAYQQKLKAQMEILASAQARQNPANAVMGAGQMPADGNPANLAPQAGAPAAAGAQPVMPAMPAPTS